MSSIILKINREETKRAKAKFIYKDIDAFSDKYAANKVDLLTDVEAVKASMRNLFMWNSGEEILYPKFGNNIRKFLYQPMDEVNKAQLAQEIQRVIEENEPRVAIETFGLMVDKNDTEHSTIRFSISYHVVGNGKSIGEKSIVDTITIGDKTIDIGK